MSDRDEAEKRGKTIGIDLGMTNAYSAILKGEQPIMITSREGGRVTPAVVGYGSDGDRFIGQTAKCQAIMNPESTFYAVNRFIGRQYDEVTDAAAQVSYQVLRGERVLAENNDRLTTVRLDGISPAPKGVPQIEVTFEIDILEFLLVSVQDLATGKTQSTTISPLKLSCDELEDKLRDANAEHETDSQVREQVENTQKAASLIRETEEKLRHLLEQEMTDRSLIVGIVEYLQNAIASQDNRREQSLNNTSLPVLVEMGKPIFYTKPELSALKAKEKEEVIDLAFDVIDAKFDWTSTGFEVID